MSPRAQPFRQPDYALGGGDITKGSIGGTPTSKTTAIGGAGTAQHAKGTAAQRGDQPKNWQRDSNNRNKVTPQSAGAPGSKSHNSVMAGTACALEGPPAVQLNTPPTPTVLGPLGHPLGCNAELGSTAQTPVTQTEISLPPHGEPELLTERITEYNSIKSITHTHKSTPYDYNDDSLHSAPPHGEQSHALARALSRTTVPNSSGACSSSESPPESVLKAELFEYKRKILEMESQAEGYVFGKLHAAEQNFQNTAQQFEFEAREIRNAEVAQAEAFQRHRFLGEMHQQNQVVSLVTDPERRASGLGCFT